MYPLTVPISFAEAREGKAAGVPVTPVLKKSMVGSGACNGGWHDDLGRGKAPLSIGSQLRYFHPSDVCRSNIISDSSPHHKGYTY